MREMTTWWWKEREARRIRESSGPIGRAEQCMGGRRYVVGRGEQQQAVVGSDRPDVILVHKNGARAQRSENSERGFQSGKNGDELGRRSQGEIS
jgi:hypothetical protein